MIHLQFGKFALLLVLTRYWDLARDEYVSRGIRWSWGGEYRKSWGLTRIPAQGFRVAKP